MCDHCECLYINGLKCHELGCPVAYKDKPIECAWCGNNFLPETEYQKTCCEECLYSYIGE